VNWRLERIDPSRQQAEPVPETDELPLASEPDDLFEPDEFPERGDFPDPDEGTA